MKNVWKSSSCWKGPFRSTGPIFCSLVLLSAFNVFFLINSATQAFLSPTPGFTACDRFSFSLTLEYRCSISSAGDTRTRLRNSRTYQQPCDAGCNFLNGRDCRGGWHTFWLPNIGSSWRTVKHQTESDFSMYQGRILLDLLHLQAICASRNMT